MLASNCAESVNPKPVSMKREAHKGEAVAEKNYREMLPFSHLRLMWSNDGVAWMLPGGIVDKTYRVLMSESTPSCLKRSISISHSVWQAFCNDMRCYWLDEAVVRIRALKNIERNQAENWKDEYETVTKEVVAAERKALFWRAEVEAE